MVSSVGILLCSVRGFHTRLGHTDLIVRFTAAFKAKRSVCGDRGAAQKMFS